MMSVQPNQTPVVDLNDSMGPGPLEKSAMIMQVGSEKRSSEKAGAGPSAAPKIESNPSSGEKGSNKDASASG